MNSNRATSIAVGVLFITATAGYVGGQAIYGPLIDSSDFLAVVHPHRERLVVGLLVELAGILAIPLIAAFLFPILRRSGEGVALGYLALRTIEALLLLIVVVDVLSIAEVSRAYLQSGPTPDAYWESLGSSLQLVSEWPFLLSVAVVFPLGSILLNCVLFRERLVPRLIAGWGVLGAALLLTGSMLDLLGVLPEISDLGLELTISGPIAIQEMVLAVWLIARGFDIRPEHTSQETA